MRARLIVLHGSPTPPIDLRLPTVLGRGADAKLKLPASTVSRQHCEIYAYEGQIAVRDLGSANGTVVNGHRVEVPTLVTADDEVTVGPIRFRLVALPAAPATETLPQGPPAEASAEVEDREQQTPASRLSSPAESVDAASDPSPVYEAGETTENGSILRYRESADDSRPSFVDIVADEALAEPESNAPDLQVDDGLDRSVSNDDSALQDFFDQIDS